jgi:hypothetical protein
MDAPAEDAPERFFPALDDALKRAAGLAREPWREIETREMVAELEVFNVELRAAADNA